VPWKVEFLDERVAKEIEDLPAEIQARFDHIVALIEELGVTNVREPHVKHLRGKLWEMRMKGRDGIARAIYVTATGQRVVVVYAFTKKTEKTPHSALEIAEARAKEVG
jgi:phage-related protein